MGAGQKREQRRVKKCKGVRSEEAMSTWENEKGKERRGGKWRRGAGTKWGRDNKQQLENGNGYGLDNDNQQK